MNEFAAIVVVQYRFNSFSFRWPYHRKTRLTELRILVHIIKYSAYPPTKKKFERFTVTHYFLGVLT